MLSLPCLSLLLLRGRHAAPGALHLVASSPLHQNMDPLVRLGWEVSIMKRVEIYEREVVDYAAGKLVSTQGVVDKPGGPNPSRAPNGIGGAADGTANKQAKGTTVKGGKSQDVDKAINGHDPEVRQATGGEDTEAISAVTPKKPAAGSHSVPNGSHGKASTNDHDMTPAHPAPLSLPPPPPGPAPGMRRYKEQGVDEILTLKLLQTIYAKDIEYTPEEVGHQSHGPTASTTTPTKCAKPLGTIVLATGDARGGQFNAGGFLGAVRHAIRRGWAVELWSFASGMSRAWRETARREGWNGRFRVHTMDEWKEWLVDVNEDLAD